VLLVIEPVSAFDVEFRAPGIAQVDSFGLLHSGKDFSQVTAFGVLAVGVAEVEG
jgi:hypothetical protein